MRTTLHDGFVVEILVVVQAPDRAAAERIGEDVRKAALRTNVRVRDGRIDNVIVTDVRADSDD
jgi:hypothetical protein